MMQTIKFLALVLSLSILGCEPSIQPTSVQGHWQSDQDAKSFLKIDKEKMYFVYGDELVDRMPYTFQSNCPENCNHTENACLLVQENGESACYSILEADGKKLALVYTNGNGQPLVFSSTEAFSIPEEKPKTLPITTQCYIASTDTKNTFSLELTSDTEQVFGYLTIQQPPHHTGIGRLIGTMENNLIIADYTFQIEGDTQIEELIFKIDGDKLYQAEGELIMEAGKSVLKDKTNLDFSIYFMPTDCPAISEAIGWSKEAYAPSTETTAPSGASSTCDCANGNIAFNKSEPSFMHAFDRYNILAICGEKIPFSHPKAPEDKFSYSAFDIIHCGTGNTVASYSAKKECLIRIQENSFEVTELKKLPIGKDWAWELSPLNVELFKLEEDQFKSDTKVYIPIDPKISPSEAQETLAQITDKSTKLTLKEIIGRLEALSLAGMQEAKNLLTDLPKYSNQPIEELNAVIYQTALETVNDAYGTE